MAADPDRVELREIGGGIEFAVKVVPGASRTRIAGVWNRALRVAVSAPAEGGRANAAVVALISSALGVGRSEVAIVGGSTRPLKMIRVGGIDGARFRAKLGEAP